MNDKHPGTTVTEEHYSVNPVKIDVLIPAIDKDLPVLPSVIDGIRNNVLHPIENIYIVAPDSSKIKELCKQKNCIYIFEDSVLPVDKNKIYARGWMLQQLLKLSCDTICTMDHYLIVDADTIFIAPHIYMFENKTVFYCGEVPWRNKYVFDHFRRLTKLEPLAKVCMVNHSMFFTKYHLAELKKWIESIHKKKWYEAILDTIDPTSTVPFSEYETYGNFMLNKFKGNVYLARAKNLGIKAKEFHKYTPEDLNKLAKTYNSVSFHNRPGD
ncbi:DUF6492 family protein [Niallia sp. Krafla_26]|uniref:DUF6492 family protein n=1 Tax=Niallia sp. Krafla_26 TaxID=3064703 RepID=UPI003D183578